MLSVYIAAWFPFLLVIMTSSSQPVLLQAHHAAASFGLHASLVCTVPEILPRPEDTRSSVLLRRNVMGLCFTSVPHTTRVFEIHDFDRPGSRNVLLHSTVWPTATPPAGPGRSDSGSVRCLAYLQ